MHFRHCILLPLLLPSALPLLAADKPPFQDIDKHALDATIADEASIESLAAYLAKPAKDDADKARAIFRWLADRIAYDVTLLHQAEPNRAENVLKNRKAVCQGYADLYCHLGKAAGLEVVMVRGFARGYSGSTAIDRVPEPNHRWNAVKLNGEWRLLDATWGAGYLMNNEFHKSLREFFFLTPPDKLIFSHYPLEPEWQLLTPPVKDEEFIKYVKSVNTHLLYHGVATEDVKKTIAAPNFREMVKPLDLTDGKMTIKEAPLSHYLKAGGKYRFKFESESSEFPRMAIINQNQWTILQQKGTTFETTATLRADQNCKLVRFKQKGNNRMYNTFLEYVVE